MDNLEKMITADEGSEPARKSDATIRASQSVCAVVVTYNRKASLARCLDALLAQTYPLERVLVIDNASNDGTEALFGISGAYGKSPFNYIRLPANRGGAGGFHEGLKNAAQLGNEWLWLLDDDTIARPTALSEIFAARNRFDEGGRPDMLASKVLWTDGNLHHMNTPFRRQDDPGGACDAAERGCVPLRAATFVSLLMHRRFIEQFGLPLADYFIWGDDTEYTARILRTNPGVIVPRSVVVHETTINHTAMNAEPARFYYFVRNELWIVFRSQAFTSKERAKRLYTVVRHTAIYLHQRKYAWSAIRWVVVALGAAFFKRPHR